MLVLLAVAPAAAAQTDAGEDKALGRPATASSFQQPAASTVRGGCISPTCDPGKAVDGDPTTRWSSAFADDQWWQVDLGSVRLVDSTRIAWARSFAPRYAVSTSVDGSNFSPVAVQLFLVGSDGPGRRPQQTRVVTTSFPAIAARYVRVQGLGRSTRFGISFWTAQVLGPPDPPPPVAQAAPVAPPPPPPAPAVRPPVAPAARPPVAPATQPPVAPATQPPVAPAARRASFIGPFPIVRIRGRLTDRGVRVSVISVRSPRGTRVEVRCRSRRCPLRRTLVRNRRGSVRVARFERYLRAGAVLEIFVTQRGRIGKYTRFRIRSRRAPARTDACVAPGSHRPIRCRVG